MSKLKNLFFRSMDMGVDGKLYTVTEHSIMTLVIVALVALYCFVLLFLPWWLGLAGLVVGYLGLIASIDKLHKLGVRQLRNWL